MEIVPGAGPRLEVAASADSARSPLQGAEIHQLVAGVRATGWQIVGWAACTLVALAIALKDFATYQLGTYRDDATYLLLAESLLYTDTYGLVNAPGQPVATYFPFGYPLLLSLVLRLFPSQFEIVQATSLLITLLNGALLFWAWRPLIARSSYWWAVAVSGLYLLSPLVIEHTRMVMSEPLFTTLCLVSVILAKRLADGRGGGWTLFCLGLALVSAAYVRSVGWILVGAVLVYLGWRMRAAAASNVAAIAAVMVGILAVVVTATPVQVGDLFPANYISQAGQFAQHAVAGTSTAREWSATEVVGLRLMAHVGGNIPGAILPVNESLTRRLGGLQTLDMLPLVLGYLISALIGLGALIRVLRSGLSPYALFAGTYLSVLVVAWFWEGQRLLYPILPELQLWFLVGVYALIQGLQRLSRKAGGWFNARAGQVLLVGVVLGLLGFSAYRSEKIDDSRLHAGDLVVRTAWVKANVEPNATIMSEASDVDHLYSGRKTIPYPAQLAPAQIESAIERRQPDYILVAPNIAWQQAYTPHYSDLTSRVLPVLEDLAARGELERVYYSERDMIRVYRRPGRGASSGSPPGP